MKLLSDYDVLVAFYSAFARGDVEGMRLRYADDVVFSDPMFPHLHGQDVWAMWKMLVTQMVNLRVTINELEMRDGFGHASWQADYTYSRTHRRVSHRVCSRLAFEDGNIIRHADSFDLRRWIGMALGPTGQLFGWLGPMQDCVRLTAAAALQDYMMKGGGQDEP